MVMPVSSCRRCATDSSSVVATSTSCCVAASSGTTGKLVTGKVGSYAMTMGTMGTTRSSVIDACAVRQGRWPPGRCRWQPRAVHRDQNALDASGGDASFRRFAFAFRTQHEDEDSRFPHDSVSDAAEPGAAQARPSVRGDDDEIVDDVARATNDHFRGRAAQNGARRRDVCPRLELVGDRLEIFLLGRRVGVPLPRQVGVAGEGKRFVDQHDVDRRDGLTSDERGVTGSLLGQRRSIEWKEQFAKHGMPRRERLTGSILTRKTPLRIGD